MAVVDASAIQKLTSQLNELKRQFEELARINAQLQDQIRALGAAGRISLPMLNVERLGRQFRRDLSCLTPDWQALMPRVDLDEVNLGSICGRTAFFRSTLFVDRERLRRAPGPAARTEELRRVKERRVAVLVDAVTKSLSQADQNQEAVEELADATDDLERTIDTAETVNDRLAAIAQGQAVVARAQALTVQILAQMQRADAAFYLNTATSIEDTPPDAEGEGGGIGAGASGE